jgi:hypothetical protein
LQGFTLLAQKAPLAGDITFREADKGFKKGEDTN